MATPRVVVVTRPTPYERLLARHATRGQAQFFLTQHGQRLEPLEAAHHRFRAALAEVLDRVPVDWRRSHVDRSELDRFLFEPDDVVVALGQDGLVANVAKYLDEQLVIGLDPDPEHNAGVLVPHPPAAFGDLLSACARGHAKIAPRTMVQAWLPDGQTLRALNEIFVGHRSHQSARYRVAWREREARHVSSGVVVATGTGTTGWARSIHRARTSQLRLPAPADPALVFFVREAFPSRSTDTALTEGRVRARDALRLTSEMEDGGVLFGDGIEADYLAFPYGVTVEIRRADRALQLVAGA